MSVRAAAGSSWAASGTARRRTARVTLETWRMAQRILPALVPSIESRYWLLLSNALERVECENLARERHRLQNGAMRKIVFLLLVLATVSLFASDFDKLVMGVVNAYGGEAAWKGVHAIRQSGSVTTMTGKQGKMTRTWDRAHKLHVEIGYADRTEDRKLDGAQATKKGKPATGVQLE